ncbi:MAG: superoxide dismutase family protein [Vicinamibacterales bacterium]
MKGSRLMLSGGAVAAIVVSGAIVSAQQPTSKPATTSKTETTRAVADIKGSGITGRAELVQRKQGTGTVVDVTVTVSGLKPGQHGVHLHAIGKCEPDFAAAGGHFDPGPASNTDPDANHPFHMGDVPNLEAGQDGKGTLKAITTRVTLSAGPLSIFDTDGTAIIVHGNPDQGITGAAKSGVSGGPRVACGVFTR